MGSSATSKEPHGILHHVPPKQLNTNTQNDARVPPWVYLGTKLMHSLLMHSLSHFVQPTSGGAHNLFTG